MDGPGLGDLCGDEAPVCDPGGREQAESDPGEPLLRPGAPAEEARQGGLSVHPRLAAPPLSAVRHPGQVISEQIEFSSSANTC